MFFIHPCKRKDEDKRFGADNAHDESKEKEEVNSEEVKSKLEEMDIRINDVAMVKNYILNEDGIKDKLVLRWMY